MENLDIRVCLPGDELVKNSQSQCQKDICSSKLENSLNGWLEVMLPVAIMK